MTARGAAWLLLASLVLASRLTHSGILWIEEAYPAAAAAQADFGKQPYRDFFFDKPPGSVYLYQLWDAQPGVLQRIAGACFVVLCAWLAYLLARRWWGEREAWLAGGLLAFHLTFYVPSAVMPLAPDLLMVAPHLAAVLFARSGRTWAAGVAAGIALLLNSKGLLVVGVCALWSVPAALIGLAIGASPLLVNGYGQQVWVWGLLYSDDTLVESVWREGLLRSLNWMGFHAAIVIGTAWFFWREHSSEKRRAVGWVALSVLGVCLGGRFFPRYYFQLLPLATVLGARGLVLLPKRWMLAGALGLLLIPAVRFGPRYVDLALHGDGDWSDTAMNRDSRSVARELLGRAEPGDTILVWGYRPDILVYARLPLGAPFLDSQPLTGVLADRHLASSTPTAPDVAAANRTKLRSLSPTWVVDGLGPYNQNLAITAFPDLSGWLSYYEVAWITEGAVVYRRTNSGSGSSN